MQYIAKNHVCFTTSHLKWKLVCQEGAHQVTAVPSQPQQQKPNGEGAVHIPRFTRTVVLPAIRNNTENYTPCSDKREVPLRGPDTYGREETMKQRMDRRPRQMLAMSLPSWAHSPRPSQTHCEPLGQREEKFPEVLTPKTPLERTPSVIIFT